MLSGDNGILQKATDAKENTEKATIIEQARTDILGQQTNNKGINVTKEQLATILNKYFKPTDTNSIPNEVSSEDGHDLDLETTDEKYTIKLSEIFKGRLASENVVETLGEKYEDSMIGKTIDYKSEKNNINEWIILGKQTNAGKNDIIITTKSPVSSQAIDFTLEEWKGYETKINNACKTYVGISGKLGAQDAMIKDVRSIKIEDINNAVGFSENVNTITLGGEYNNLAYPNENGSGWIVKGTDENYSSWIFPNEAYYYYNNNGYKYSSVTNGYSDVNISLSKGNNMKYIVANNVSYHVASRSVDIDSGTALFYVADVNNGHVNCWYPLGLCASETSGGYDDEGGGRNNLRPVVILSSEIPWNDVKDLIGNYATYN